MPADANHTFLHDRASNKRYNLLDSLHIHEKFLSSYRPSGVEISEAEGGFKRTLQSLKWFLPHCICKALCDVKTADAVAFVDSMDI